MKKPIIGISAITAFDEKYHSQRVTYAQAVWGAGGEAFLLPANPDKANCAQIVSMLDGLLIPGGPDIDPQLYGEELNPKCGVFCRYEDVYEMELIKEAVKQKKPILAICRGMQVVNVLFGGTLYQDIPSQFETNIQHSRVIKDLEIYHTVTLEKNSILAQILGEWKNIKVNSSHHQSVKKIAEGFKIVGKSQDGIVEAMENSDGTIICVQWHPERMLNEERYRKLFGDFIERCRKCKENIV